MNIRNLNFRNGKNIELSVVGHPSDFYVYDSKRLFSWSKSLTSSNGARKYLPILIKAKKENDKKTFQKTINEIFDVFGEAHYV